MSYLEKNDGEALYYFDPPQLNLDPEIKAKNTTIWKRTGHRLLYLRLMEIGCFNGLASTPLASVKLSSWVDAIHVLSIQNATA